jgi:hypothetical protein
MSFLIYIAVALATVFGVLIEMNVLIEPARHIEHTALSTNRSLPPAVPASAVRPAAKPQAEQAEVKPPAALDKAATAKSEDVQAAPQVAPQAAAPAVPAAAAAAPAPTPKCDIAACEAAYFTFTASDCTYQPSNGPRRLCSKGTPPGASADASSATGASNGTEAQAAARCNQTACARAYFTFNPADCTYQPTVGPRRLCTK